MISFHFSALVSWCRPPESRIMYITAHSFTGHFSFVTALVAVFLVNAAVCQEIQIEAGVLAGIPLIVFFAGCGLQLMQDKGIEGQVNRHLFPVLEGLKIRDPNPSCHCMKVFILLVGIVLQVAGAVLIFVDYQIINQHDILGPWLNVVNDREKENLADDLEYTFVGLFSNCTQLNHTTVLAILRSVRKW